MIPADRPVAASRRRILARTRLDFWLDAVLLVAYTLAYSLGFTRSPRTNGSVEVLVRVYARCVTGLEDVWIGRMDNALHLGDR